MERSTRKTHGRSARYSYMKVFLTGGAGFIGSAVAHSLETLGARVTIFDVLQPSSGREDYQPGNVLSADLVRKVIHGHDYVIHAAARVGVESCFADPEAVEETNVKGTEAVIDAASCVDGLKGFLFVSSSEVYGDGSSRRFRESDHAQPKTLYGHTKVIGEELTRAMSRRTGIQSTVVRLFNVYGPRQRAEFVIPRFIKQASADEPITIYGECSQIRSFTFIDDAVQGICRALLRGSVGDLHDVFNIGRDEPVSILTLANLIKAATASRSAIRTQHIAVSSVRSAPQEITYRVPDASKAAALLGFTASVSLSQGLSHMLRAPLLANNVRDEPSCAIR